MPLNRQPNIPDQDVFYAELINTLRDLSDERADIYMKGTVRIRVVWAGDQDVSGASLFHDQWYESYTRDPSTVSAWLKR